MLMYAVDDENLIGSEMIGVLLILFAIGVCSLQDGKSELRSGRLVQNAGVSRGTQSRRGAETPE